MAERTRFEASGDERMRRLAAALRREARAERPGFSAALQERVVEALAAERPVRPARPAARVGAAGALVAAACMAVLVATGGQRPAPPAPVAAGTVFPHGIEVLPTPEEIGAIVLAEARTLAAAAVGVPDLTDLAAFDPAAFVAAADPRP